MLMPHQDFSGFLVKILSKSWVIHQEIWNIFSKNSAENADHPSGFFWIFGENLAKILGDLCQLCQLCRLCRLCRWCRLYHLKRCLNCRFFEHIPRFRG